MPPLFQSLLAAIIVSLISLIGILVLPLEKRFTKFLLFLVSFSAGGLLGGAFFHLLPESLTAGGKNVFVFTLVGFAAFFILEKVLRWRHCHTDGCLEHEHLGYLNLVGDVFHNLLDGLIIVSAFSANTALGMTVSFSIMLHEIPQEIGDFGVLMYAGFKKVKALLYNLLSALFALIGVVLGYFLIGEINHFNNFLLPFAAGGFIYIAASDLVPELHKERETKSSIISFIFFALAIIFMLLVAHD